MQRQWILGILLLKYILSESQSLKCFNPPLTLEFYFAFTKPTWNGSVEAVMRLCPKRDTDHYFVLIPDEIDEKSILIRAVNCTDHQSPRRYCAQSVQSTPA